ncbi:M3 family metallopeptidase [Pusillimonas sp. CC-YST705]|uniref:oligopeptidase A n=1 Tax=Mesopusillimonas faecipullorum TaxID=2755040 RepID=A0ABS8CBB4_9BURK|nr:M3 family metallopeptidase [Mesopusillimonas faecipullorum]MCB5363154.1 M3 family metallopeptidase [Mesopusillimonas faecipullorum]
MTNPLLAPLDTLIDYVAIEPAHIEPAVDQLIEQARAAVEAAANPALPATWEAIVDPLDTAGEKLWRAWSVVGHLNAVVNTPELRQAYNDCLPKVSEFSTWTGLHLGLYQQYQRLQSSPDFQHWPSTRQRVVELALRDFQLSGVGLEGEDRETYMQLAAELAQVSQKFSENVLDAVDQWTLLIEDESRLAGIPVDVVQAARARAEEQEKAGWLLTLKMPCYLPVMQYAHDRELRATLYRAYGTLASEHGKPEQDNSALIERLLALRAQEAKLLGYADFAELRLQTRMARTAGEVQEFLRDLAHRAKPYAQRDLDELRAFAKTQYQITELEPWDLPYYAERLREKRYAYSEDEVKQYFTEPRVMQGLFQVVKTLFQVTLEACPEIRLWHPQAQALRAVDAQGQVLGYLLVDLYARQGKQGGAWVDSERNRRRIGQHLQLPVVGLTCNFTPPADGKPSVLTHDDVITLFHESGHALHALLSRVDEPGVSAFASVEWDAIELPSQFMENFCWEWPVVQALSAHVQTGEPLPRELYDKLLAARNFQSGMQTVRQIEFALFDMAIHARPEGMNIAQVLQTLNEVRQEVAVVIPPSWHRFPHNFSHLFAGGYAAGYYSYKWAEVLSADAYAAFEEAAQAEGRQDTLHPHTGKRFLDEVLAVGGTRPAADSFLAFRGRAPLLDALLRHGGMDTALSTDTASA